MLVWGGGNELGIPGDTGVRYDPATDSWKPIASQGEPSPRIDATAVWTGSELLVWGGYAKPLYGPGALQDGARYDPATDTWTPLPPPVLATLSSSMPWAVWTGTQMLLWGTTSDFPPLPPRGVSFTPDSILAVPHDERYFSQTGYRIDDDTIWDYFTHRGGLRTFGYPISRTFAFQGFTVQCFQRRVVQLGPGAHARLLNLLDLGLLPYTHFNGSTFPGIDPGLLATAPPPTDQAATLAWVQQHAPDSFQGQPVRFGQTFLDTVSLADAFPGGGQTDLLRGMDLELWGVPTSAPQVDPTNHTFIYQRWQRGIMHFDAQCQCTQGILLGDYLKELLTGQNLPSDLAAEAAASPLLRQYAPGQPGWVRDPNVLPDTDLTNAFTPG